LIIFNYHTKYVGNGRDHSLQIVAFLIFAIYKKNKIVVNPGLAFVLNIFG
jgi:hypothetical protein